MPEKVEAQAGMRDPKLGGPVLVRSAASTERLPINVWRNSGSPDAILGLNNHMLPSEMPDSTALPPGVAYGWTLIG